MPLMQCTSNGQSGWKYGPSGHCYTGPNAKQQAANQAAAMHAAGFREKSGTFELDGKIYDYFKCR